MTPSEGATTQAALNKKRTTANSSKTRDEHATRDTEWARKYFEDNFSIPTEEKITSDVLALTLTQMARIEKTPKNV